VQLGIDHHRHCEPVAHRRGALSAQREEVPLGCNPFSLRQCRCVMQLPQAERIPTSGFALLGMTGEA